MRVTYEITIVHCSCKFVIQFSPLAYYMWASRPRNPLPLLYRYTLIQTSTWWQSTYYLFILYPSFTATKKKLCNRLRSSSSSLLSAIDPISYWFSITGTLAYFPTMRPTPCHSFSSIFAVRSNLSTFTIIGSDLLLALLLYIKPSASGRRNNKTWTTEGSFRAVFGSVWTINHIVVVVNNSSTQIPIRWMDFGMDVIYRTASWPLTCWTSELNNTISYSSNFECWLTRVLWIRRKETAWSLLHSLFNSEQQHGLLCSLLIIWLMTDWQRVIVVGRSAPNLER